MKKRVEIIVKGIVQGVSFRYYTVAQTKNKSITGSVENLCDGNVRIIAEGEEGTLFELIEWTRTGPSHARVDDIDVNWFEHIGEFNDFKIKY